MSTVSYHYKADLRALRQPAAFRISQALPHRNLRACKPDSEVLEQNKSEIQRVLEKRREGKRSLRKEHHDLIEQIRAPGIREADSTTAVASASSRSTQGNQNSFDATAAPRLLSDSQLLRFERRGHICTRSLLNGAELSALHGTVHKEAKARQSAALSHRIRVLLPADKHVPVYSKEQALQHLEKHSQELGFLQYFNLHR